MNGIIEYNGIKYTKVCGEAKPGELVLAEFGEVVKVIEHTHNDIYCEDNVLLTHDEYTRLLPL